VAQVRIVTPSGMNQFHGGRFWYHRNSVLNANRFINNATRTARPFSLQNRVGFIANGPLYLPPAIFGPASYDGRNRSFWFLYYEALRQPFTVIRTRTVLTPEARAGNFPRKAVNSPSFFPLDFGILKRTRLKERANLEFRAEFFNLFNTVNFGSGTLAVDSVRFGQITGTFASRFGPLALRVNW
jgi:hypothetical protein